MQRPATTRRRIIALGTLAVLASSIVAATAKESKKRSEAGIGPAGEKRIYKKCPDGRELALYIIKPSESTGAAQRPAIVFYHGGGWVGGSPGQFNEHSKYLASRGMVAVQTQYRLLAPKGTEPPTVCIQDAKSALRWVRSHAAELGIDPQRIASAGGSAGGHLAAFVGMVDGLDDPQDERSVSARSNAMLLFNPVFDNGPHGWGHQRVGERYKEFSPFHNVSPDDPPAIVFLGSEDKLIPVRTLKEFQETMQKAGVRCEAKVYPGQPHGFFNFNRTPSTHFYDTLLESDKFLASLGWLTGPPTLKPPL